MTKIGAREKAEQIGTILDAKKATDVLLLDIGHKTILADYFVLCGGRSTIQVKALCDEVEKVMAQAGQVPRRVEGYRDGRWVVLDYSDVVVHIFHEEERAFYNLERLWLEEGYYRYLNGEKQADVSQQPAQ